MVLPNPFKILERVASQVQEGTDKRERPDKNSGVFISKRRRPASLPKKKKAPAEKIPRIRQYFIVFSTVKTITF